MIEEVDLGQHCSPKTPKSQFVGRSFEAAESERVKEQWVRGASCFSSLQPVRHLACENRRGDGPRQRPL
ncbi:hypothetical protein MHYP_G00265810 [Metynnis hypsauchen]